jgi:hypothetical protein
MSDPSNPALTTPYSRRWTGEQLIMNLLSPNGAPFGPVRSPSSTYVKI